ncbi:MAG: thioesterase II family protein [Burkholderiaceae bacterium]
MQNAPNPCFIRPKPVANPRLRLFCFPYAGGSAAIYHQWPSHVSTDIELLAIQYPGRATRLREPLRKNLNLLLDDIEQAITPLLNKPFAFFGHSMGATVAYELTRRLYAGQKPLPMHLFFSGRSAPHLPAVKPPVHNLPDKEFLESMRNLNGTPAELLEHSELMELMLPIIRTDFQLLETWEHQASPPFNIPVSVFGGLADDGVPLENLDAWAACTTGKMKRHMFPGDHFFLHQQYPAMLNIINRALSSE